MPHWFPPLSTAKGCSIVIDQTHTHTRTHGALIAPIRAQTLLPLSSALLGDLHITSLHAVTQTEACKDAHTHRKEDQTGPPQQQKKKNLEEPTVCFLWRVKLSVTVMWPPYSMQTNQWGGGVKVRWTCVCVCVRASFQAACSDDEVVP